MRGDIKSLNPALMQLNNIQLENTIRDFRKSIDRVEVLSAQIGSLTNAVSVLNRHLDPISRMANTKLTEFDLESKARVKRVEQDSLMQIVRMKSRDLRITESEAYDLVQGVAKKNTLAKEEGYNTGLVHGATIVGLMTGAFALFTNAKL